MPTAGTCPILKLRRPLLPPVSPGRGNPINTSQGCVACTKTFCARGMSGRRYGIIHSVPPACGLRPSPASSWNWFAGGRRPDAGGTIQAFFNLTAQPQTIPFQDLATVLWTSEAERYHGGRRADMAKERLLPYECMVFGSTRES